jgi:peptidyl-dipeptidase Dcp
MSAAMEHDLSPDINPLLARWTGPFEAPPFDSIKPSHFVEAFETALSLAQTEIDAIAANPEAPSFENAIIALERSGRLLTRVSSVFFNLATADTNDAIQAIEREIAPKLARRRSAVYLNEPLFRRVDVLYARREELGLDAEQVQLLHRYHVGFSRNGAGLPDSSKARLAEIAERLATLGTEFLQNVLADEKAYLLLLTAKEDLTGLPPQVVYAAAQAAADRGALGKHAVTLSRSSVEPFLQFSARRDLRENAFRAWVSRGETEGPTDNRAIAAEMVRLRAERARLLGFVSFAHYRLDDTMAKTPQAVQALLRLVWEPARAQAQREEGALQAIAAEGGENFKIAPWDWRYAEKHRKRAFDFDESEIKPYLQLENMINAAFFTANRLFGLSFSERKDIRLYHQDARCWSVTACDGREIELFIGDYFARLSKRSGAWMNSFRQQQRLDGEVKPIVVNVSNFAKGGENEPCLLSFDDAHTLFHEFGHALHGLLSNVTYPLISGTNVARDFVEFPSQLYEHWLEQREILGRFARHYETNEPMPEELLDKLLAARQFNQGFATVEYTASALVDLALHLTSGGEPIDIISFEENELLKLGLPASIKARHRTPHFQHIFAGGHYAAGYYSYLWSEVLDADGFAAFEESGDIFEPELAERLREHIYSAGFTRDPEEAYLAFRGRMPSPEALLKNRGLIEAAAAATA